jgi:hypothetical protein
MASVHQGVSASGALEKKKKVIFFAENTHKGETDLTGVKYKMVYRKYSGLML